MLTYTKWLKAMEAALPAEEPVQPVQPEEPRIKPAPQPPSEGFDPVKNHTQTGKYFAKFFSDVSTGKFGKSDVQYKSALDVAHAAPFQGEFHRHVGNFDDHIAKSIPTYRESMIRKGHAIVAAFGNQPVTMLDIGGSEGSFAKAVTAMSKGNIKTKVLDPNPDMHQFFDSKSRVEGSHYDRRAFHRGWVEDDGTEIPAMNADNSSDRFDIIHEAMVFQFINNQRATQIVESKRLLKPGGLLITEEKLKTPKEQWDRNELFKDREFKNIYYSPQELAAKQKVVGFQQDKAETKAVGMVDNMVTVGDFERILTESFREVWQYWDSGNFKGYVASDDPEKVKRFVQAVGDMNSKFSTIKTPRRVMRMAIPMGERIVPFGQWLREHTDLEAAIRAVLPEEEKIKKMAGKHLRKEFGPKVKQAAEDLGVKLSDEEIEDFFKNLLGDEPELIDFDVQHYHYHL